MHTARGMKMSIYYWTVPYERKIYENYLLHFHWLYMTFHLRQALP